MYVCTGFEGLGIIDGRFVVYDTSDGSEERVTWDDMESVVQSDIPVFGMSEFQPISNKWFSLLFIVGNSYVFYDGYTFIVGLGRVDFPSYSENREYMDYTKAVKKFDINLEDAIKALRMCNKVYHMNDKFNLGNRVKALGVSEGEISCADGYSYNVFNIIAAALSGGAIPDNVVSVGYDSVRLSDGTELRPFDVLKASLEDASDDSISSGVRMTEDGRVASIDYATQDALRKIFLEECRFPYLGEVPVRLNSEVAPIPLTLSSKEDDYLLTKLTKEYTTDGHMYTFSDGSKVGDFLWYLGFKFWGMQSYKSYSAAFGEGVQFSKALQKGVNVIFRKDVMDGKNYLNVKDPSGMDRNKANWFHPEWVYKDSWNSAPLILNTKEFVAEFHDRRPRNFRFSDRTQHGMNAPAPFMTLWSYSKNSNLILRPCSLDYDVYYISEPLQGDAYMTTDEVIKYVVEYAFDNNIPILNGRLIPMSFSSLRFSDCDGRVKNQVVSIGVNCLVRPSRSFLSLLKRQSKDSSLKLYGSEQWRAACGYTYMTIPLALTEIPRYDIGDCYLFKALFMDMVIPKPMYSRIGVSGAHSSCSANVFGSGRDLYQKAKRQYLKFYNDALEEEDEDLED